MLKKEIENMNRPLSGKETEHVSSDNVNSRATLQKQFSSFLKLDINFSYDPAILPLNIYIKRNETCVKDFYRNIHGSNIYDSSKLETVQVVGYL